jgi:hypothetical protein
LQQSSCKVISFSCSCCFGEWHQLVLQLWWVRERERERESALHYLFRSWRKLASIPLSFDEPSLLLVLLESCSSFLRFFFSWKPS